MNKMAADFYDLTFSQGMGYDAAKESLEVSYPGATEEERFEAIGEALDYFKAEYAFTRR